LGGGRPAETLVLGIAPLPAEGLSAPGVAQFALWGVFFYLHRNVYGRQEKTLGDPAGRIHLNVYVIALIHRHHAELHRQ